MKPALYLVLISVMARSRVQINDTPHKNSVKIDTRAAKSPVQIDDIVGGFAVDPPFKYPWMVHLEKDKKWWCGAVLLNMDTVLTAGHCSNPTQVTPGPNLKAFAHRHNLQVEYLLMFRLPINRKTH